MNKYINNWLIIANNTTYKIKYKNYAEVSRNLCNFNYLNLSINKIFFSNRNIKKIKSNNKNNTHSNSFMILSKLIHHIIINQITNQITNQINHLINLRSIIKQHILISNHIINNPIHLNICLPNKMLNLTFINSCNNQKSLHISIANLIILLNLTIITTMSKNTPKSNHKSN